MITTVSREGRDDDDDNDNDSVATLGVVPAFKEAVAVVEVVVEAVAVAV